MRATLLTCKPAFAALVRSCLVSPAVLDLPPVAGGAGAGADSVFCAGILKLVGMTVSGGEDRRKRGRKGGLYTSRTTTGEWTMVNNKHDEQGSKHESFASADHLGPSAPHAIAQAI